MTLPTGDAISVIGIWAMVGLVNLCIAAGLWFGAGWGFAGFGCVCLFVAVLGIVYEEVIEKLRTLM